jgi:hypothetical protein
MKYMLTWSAPTPTYATAINKFVSTGGNPPSGVKLLGRYHALSGSASGFILAESSDPKGIYAWSAEWAHLIDLQIVPVIEDAEAAPILQGIKR